MNYSEFETIVYSGKAEWLENAPDTYSHDALDVWHTDILPRILSASLEEFDIEDLRLFCPKMLEELQDIFVHDAVEDIRHKIQKIIRG